LGLIRASGEDREAVARLAVQINGAQSDLDEIAERNLDLPTLREHSPNGDIQPNVFLCHSSDDKDAVRSLYRRLTVDGVVCWFDEESLPPGDNWEYEIEKAISVSRYVLVCRQRRQLQSEARSSGRSPER
jgi:hypothetical protein